MFANTSIAKALTDLGAFKPAPILDSAGAPVAKRTQVLDEALQSSANGALSEIRSAAINSVHQWCETEADDLDAGESMADRLIALMVGIADENKDGEITDDEAGVIDVALNAAFDYIVSKGVSEDDASALLNDGDGEAADRVCELLRGELPQGEEASMDDVDSFAFDAEAQEPLMDSVFDAVYKKRIVIRAGKKVRINKRVSGTVRLTASQKVSIRKAGMKSRSAGARMHRMRSMKLRTKMGLK